MQITPVQNNRQNTQSFKMNLEIADKATEIAIKRNLKSFLNDCVPELKENHFGNRPFNINSLKTAFKKFTKDVGGTVRIKLEETTNADPLLKDDWLNLDYIDKTGKIVHSSNPFLPSSLLRDKYFDNGQPFKSATSRIVADIADIIAHSGVGYGKENKVSKLFDKMSDGDIDITSLCEVKGLKNLQLA